MSIRSSGTNAGRSSGWVPHFSLTAAALIALAAGEARATDLTTATSSMSPIAGCVADAGQSGTNYSGTEIEPWVDVNPANARNIVAGWQQDRWSNGGARALGVGVSIDGGMGWSRSLIPGLTLCSGGGGTYQRATDPWLSFAPDGTLYFMSLVFNEDPPTGGNGANAMVVSRSTDGGHNWGSPKVLIADPAGPFFSDKNSITADRTDADLAYAVWDRLEDLPIVHGNGQSREIARGGADGEELARSRSRMAKQSWAKRTSPVNQPFLQFKGPALLSRTTNGGDSWEPWKVIYDPGVGNQTIGNQVVVRPDGTVFAFFTEILNTAPGGQVNLAYKVSTDKAATIESEPVQRVGAMVSDGVLTPDLRKPVRDASILFDVAVDPSNGKLYAVWQDRRFAGVEQVAFSMSSDGSSWSAPIRIGSTPASKNKLREQGFVPSVAVMANGKVVVTYYDFRNDDKTGELADYWSISCNSNCGSSASWSGEQRLTSASFNMLAAPVAGGYFLGDYMGLAGKADNSAIAVFGIAPGASNLTDLVARQISAP